MSDEKPPTYVSITISCDSEDARISYKALKTLARSLNRSVEELEATIIKDSLKLPRVRVSDHLIKLVNQLKSSNASIKVKPIRDRPRSLKNKNHQEEDTTVHAAEETTGAWARAGWKKGDVIEGLYKVVGEAQGGMGKVYFVFHRTWRMMLAIKTPLPQAVKSPSHLARFMREAELWVNLGVHPNIATCYYARVINGLPRLFIEYVDGGTLEDWINEKKISSYSKAADVMLQFCYGMIRAESMGMIHRDIKPANCLMTKDGTLKITDFGLVKRLEESGPKIDTNDIDAHEGLMDIESDVTVAEGGVRGSPWWMAPERFTKKHPVDIRSDIYSFGLMLYRLTVGAMPFSYRDGKDLKSIILAHAKKPPRDPLSIRPDLPKPILEVIMKCLDKDPANRHSSFEETAQAMESVLGELKSAKMVKRPDNLGLQTDSLNNQAVSLMDLGRVDEAVKLFEDSQSANPDHLESVYNLHSIRWKRSEATDMDLVSVLNSLKIEVRETSAFSHLMGLVSLQRGDRNYGLEQLTKAYENAAEYRAWWMEQGKDPENFIRKLGYAPIYLKGKLAGHIKAVRQIGFGPLGDTVYSVGEDRSIRIWDFMTGRCRKNLRTFAFAPLAGAISMDGRIAATCYGDTYKTVDIWDLKQGRPLKKQGGMAVTGLDISTDSGMLVGYGGSDIRIWPSIGDNAPTKLKLPEYNITSVCFAEDSSCLVIADETGSVKLYDIENSELIWSIQAHDGPVTCLSLSEDGRTIFSGGSDERIMVLELSEGAEQTRLLGHRSVVNSVKPIPGSKYVVSVSQDSTIRIWDPDSSRCFRTLTDSDEPFTCCDVSPEGTTMVTGGIRGAIQIWEIDTRWFDRDFLEPAVSTPKTYVELRGLHEEFITATEEFYKAWGAFEHSTAVRAFERMTQVPGYCWSKESIQVRTLLRNTFIYEDLKSASFIRSFRGHKSAITSMHGSRDCLVLVTGGSDGMAFAWDVVTGAEIISMEVGSPVLMVYCLPRASGALTLSEDMKLRSWGPDGAAAIIAENILPPVFVSEDCKSMAAINGEGTPVNIDLASGKVKSMGEKLPENAIFKEFSPSLKYLYCIRNGSKIQRWDVVTGRFVGAYRDLGVDINAMASLDSDSKLISATSDGDIHVYMAGSGVNVTTVKASGYGLRSISIGPTQDICVSGGDDYVARVLNISNSRLMASLEGHGSWITSLYFFRNGSMIASGDSSGSVRLWGLTWALSDSGFSKRGRRE